MAAAEYPKATFPGETVMSIKEGSRGHKGKAALFRTEDDVEVIVLCRSIKDIDAIRKKLGFSEKTNAAKVRDVLIVAADSCELDDEL